MSNKVLKKFINNIQDNKPINLARFIQTIDSLNLYHRFNRNSDIQATKRKNNQYLVSYINEQLMSELIKIAHQSGTNRIDSARQNSSHDFKVMGSFLLMVQVDLSIQSTPHPIVITFDQQGNPTYPTDVSLSSPFLLAKDIVLLENRQLFLHWQATIDFLQTYCGFNNSRFDIIYSAGNEGSNALHGNFLQQYDKLYLCTDIDLGGMMIARNILNLISDSDNDFEYLLPHDIDERLANVVNQCKDSYINDVRKLANEQPKLAQIANFIATHHKTLEQESFLYELPN